MDFMRFVFDNDMSQRVDISHLQEAASQGAGTMSALESRVRRLEEDLSRVVLVNEALVRILKDRSLASDDELRKLVEAIDGEDGVVDGRISRRAAASPDACAGCGRPLPSRGRRCYYCGTSSH